MKIHNSKLIKNHIKHTLEDMFYGDMSNIYIYFLLLFVPLFVLSIGLAAWFKMNSLIKFVVVLGTIIFAISIIVFVKILIKNIQRHERYIQFAHECVYKLQASLEDIEKNGSNEEVINSYIGLVDKCYGEILSEAWFNYDDERVDKLLRTLTDISDNFKQMKTVVCK